MLRFLTDEHISPKGAVTATQACPDLEVIPIRDWQRGHLLGGSDDLVLREAHRQSLTLVTYDLRTIPTLLRAWGEEGIDHSGVVLIDDQTIRPTDIGKLGMALCQLWKIHGMKDWVNRVVFLRGMSS